ncbi:hypothetical protein ACFXO9_01000 [Nocardia tengchongensis]|uniref:hypothetical protein n=1 Tax=Nocardia tengchongensis TaxID=2055889 RepID=UPI0036BE8B6E
MTDNHDQWRNPQDPASSGAPGAHSPQDPNQQAWGQQPTTNYAGQQPMTPDATMVHPGYNPTPGQAPVPNQPGYGPTAVYSGQTPVPNHPGYEPTAVYPGQTPVPNHPGYEPTAVYPGQTPVPNHPGYEPTAVYPGQMPTLNHPGYEPTAVHPGQAPASNYPGYEPTATYTGQTPVQGFPGQDPSAMYPGQYPGQQVPPNYPGQPPIPGYGQPMPAPGGGPNRTWLIVAAIVGVIVLVGGGIAAYALTRDSSGGTTAAPTSTVGSAPTSRPGSPSATGPSKSGAPKPGGNTVTLPDYGISYDVPNGWTIADRSDTELQTGADGSFVGHGKATEGNGYCPGSAYRTLAFVTRAEGGDPGAAATKVARISAQGGYSDASGGKPGAPAAVTTKSGIAGQQVESAGTWKPSLSGCATTSYSIYTFAFTGPKNALLVLAVLVDRGTPGELPADQAKQIIASVRTS